MFPFDRELGDGPDLIYMLLVFDNRLCHKKIYIIIYPTFKTTIYMRIKYNI